MTLEDHALAAQQHAYAPYSKFKVGAAVQMKGGVVFEGVNVENASYPLSVCAERNAIAAAVAAGAKRVHAVAVATDPSDGAGAGASPAAPAPPCGACRQVLAELAGDDALVLLAGPRGAAEAHALGALIPRAFRLAQPEGSTSRRRLRWRK